MLSIKRNLPSLAKDSKEHVAICDLPGFGEFLDGTSDRRDGRHGGKWYGNMSFEQSRECVRKGDMAGVEPSDKFLREIEHLSPVTAAWQRVLSVVGGVPLVPAYLAGMPLNMVRRERTSTDTAPLAMFVEICGSASFDSDELQRRGAAILALCRALSAVRPVELWVIIAFGNPGERASICVRLDTSPLDVARAAHLLTHASVLRVLGFNAIRERLLGGSWGGGWAFADVEKQRRTGRETYLGLLAPGSEALYLPPIYTTDESISSPVKWLTEKLREYGGLEAD